MVRICTVALAMVLVTASWVVAGNFEVLADAGVVRAPTPLHIKPGTLVKAEFRSNLTTVSDGDVDSDNLLPERVSSKSDPKVTAKPAIAFREKSAGSMAPPPKQNRELSQRGPMAESLDRAREMAEDLEKDLVLSPPPVKTEEEEDETLEPTPRAETPRPADKKRITEPSDRKATPETVVKEKKKAAPAVAKPKKSPADQGRLSITQKPVQKVRPLTTVNPWNAPAGTYGDPRNNLPAQPRLSYPCAAEDQGCRPMTPPYMSSAPRQAIVPPPAVDRYVRDGVTIRLTPAAAPPVPQHYQHEEPGYNDDLFATIGEVLGMPFAFISSFF